VLTRLLLENGDVVIDCFLSWEQENEERQPSKGHFSGDQKIILQIYGLRGQKRRVGSCRVLSCCQELLFQKLLAQNPGCCDFVIYLSVLFLRWHD